MRYDVVRYFESSNNNHPEVVLPSEIFCKFMIIINDGTAFFVIGDISEFPYHANIVDRFCRERDIPAAWKRKPDVVEVFAKTTELKGGGMIDIDETKKILKIYGYSTAYGPTNVEYLKGFVVNHPFFSEYSVRFR
ncbi:MAG: hypothetical protein ACOYVF_03995 [Candidatus Zixiibacteriota bacterium]